MLLQNLRALPLLKRHVITLFKIDWFTPSSLIRHPESRAVTNGSTIILHCIFDAPAEGCYWEQDGELIAVGGRYVYLDNPENGNCSLEIREVNSRDSGSWRCGFPQTSTTSGIMSKAAEVEIGGKST